MAKKKFYAVLRGRCPGIFASWDECKAQVHEFAKAKYKGFPTRAEAELYLNEGSKENLGCSATSAASRQDPPRWLGNDMNLPIRDLGKLKSVSATQTCNSTPLPVNFVDLTADDEASNDGQNQASPSKSVSWSEKGTKEENVTLNEKQKLAVTTAQEGKNLFITGPAGTGKSVILRHIIADLKKRYGAGSPKWAVLGSTGTSAVAIGGQTLHSFAGCGVPVTVSDFGKVWNPDRREAWEKVEVMLIEEVSMMNGEFLDHLSDAVCGIRKNSSKPFGGIQLILCGDFLQLPPIPRRRKDVEDMLNAGVRPENIQRDRGFAFQSKMWRKAEFLTVVLDEVFRQNNRHFINVLHEIRKGTLSDQGEAFLKRCMRPLPPADKGIKPTILYCTNTKVNDENNKELAKLTGEEHRFTADDSVKVYDYVQNETAARIKLWGNDFFRQCTAEKEIVLKEGAQVMLIKNQVSTSATTILVNGSRGKVVRFTDPHSEVNPESDEEGDASDQEKPKESGGSRYPVVRFRNGVEQIIYPEEFTCRLAGIGECIRSAIPLKLAWAMTIHKSQGMTLDYVKVDLKGAFSDAQAYVALSRASDENGLELRNFSRRLVHSDRRAIDFYANPLASFPLWDGSLGSDEDLTVEKTGSSSVAFPNPIPGLFVGLSFVFTGELKNCSRDDAEKFVKTCGGTIRSAVSAKTNFLVIGELLDDGRAVTSSRKYEKASIIIAGENKSGMKMVNETEFFALVSSRASKRPESKDQPFSEKLIKAQGCCVPVLQNLLEPF